MVKTCVKYCCDLCKKEVNCEGELKTLPIVVRYSTDGTERRACKPYFTLEKKELCNECIAKVCKCEADFRGANLRLIEE